MSLEDYDWSSLSGYIYSPLYPIYFQPPLKSW